MHGCRTSPLLWLCCKFVLSIIYIYISVNLKNGLMFLCFSFRIHMRISCSKVKTIMWHLYRASNRVLCLTYIDNCMSLINVYFVLISSWGLWWHTQLKETNFTKLCSTKSILTVNGTFPGPTIRVYKGDTVFVNVHNQGKYGVTIHW